MICSKSTVKAIGNKKIAGHFVDLRNNYLNQIDFISSVLFYFYLHKKEK